MNYKGHLAVAAFPVVAVAAFFLLWQGASWPDSLMVGGLALAAGLYGALLPDFDIRTSKGYTITLLLGVSLALYAAFGLGWDARVVLAGFALFVAASLLPHHRKAFHHPGAAAAYMGITLAVFGSLPVAVAGMVGYLSHLVADGGHKGR